MSRNSGRVIFTVGHSTMRPDEFVKLLRSHGIERLVDVRSIPRSRHNPQFNMDVLAKYLRNRGIGYRHMKGLGGLRHARRDSVNSGWVNASFRGFADYMQSSDFIAALEKLIGQSGEKVTAIMCAEAVPWRCHRSLIADALLVRGIAVMEIVGRGARPHTMTPMAKVEGLQITYPPVPSLQAGEGASGSDDAGAN